ADLELPPYCECSDTAGSRKDSGSPWLQQNDHLHAGGACLIRNLAKTMCFERSMQYGMPMRKSTATTWIGSIPIQSGASAAIDSGARNHSRRRGHRVARSAPQVSCARTWYSAWSRRTRITKMLRTHQLSS